MYLRTWLSNIDAAEGAARQLTPGSARTQSPTGDGCWTAEGRILARFGNLQHIGEPQRSAFIPPGCLTGREVVVSARVCQYTNTRNPRDGRLRGV